MKNSILFLVIFAAILSCKPKQQATKVDNSIFNRSDADSLFLTIARSPCFGRCPQYEAKIYESGYTVYNGKRDVPSIGTHSFTLSAEQLKSLKQKAVDIKYFQMKDKYDNENVTDLPDCITSVQLDGVRKTIKNRFQGPVELAEFEKMIDGILNAAPKGKSVQTDERKD